MKDLERVPEKGWGEKINSAIAAVGPYDSEENKQKHAAIGDYVAHVLRVPGSEMRFFGVDHTNNPESKTVTKLRAELEDFLRTVPDQQVLLMIEGEHRSTGGFSRIDAIDQMAGVTSADAAVRHFGEKGLLMWVVAKAEREGRKIDIVSPEASEGIIAEKLLADGTDGRDMAAYLFLRQLTTEIGRRRLQQKSYDERRIHLGRVIHSIDRLTHADSVKNRLDERGLAELRSDPAALLAYADSITADFVADLNARLSVSGVVSEPIIPSVENLLAGDPELVDIKAINELSDPMDFGARHSSINKISARWNQGRDRYLVEQIGLAMAAGEVPFVTFGASHAISVENALQHLGT